MKKKILFLFLLLTFASMIVSCRPKEQKEEEITPKVEPNTIEYIEEEPVEEEVVEQEILLGLNDVPLTIHYKRPTYVNFDAYFTTVVPASGEMVSTLDQGYIIYYIGDYFHHNTRKFLNVFWQCKAGVKVKINGIMYTSGGIYHGYVEHGKIWYDNGDISWYDNPTIELITCDGGSGTTLRWILKLY